MASPDEGIGTRRTIVRLVDILTAVLADGLLPAVEAA